jgi:hypothetical protein
VTRDPEVAPVSASAGAWPRPENDSWREQPFPPVAIQTPEIRGSGPRSRLRDKNAANGACRVYHSLCRSGGAKDRSRQLLHAQLATRLPLTPEEQGLALGWLSDLAVFSCRCRKSKLSPRVMHASRSLLCMRREDVQFLGAGRHPRITIARAAVTTVPSPTELRGMGRGEGLLESSR